MGAVKVEFQGKKVYYRMGNGKYKHLLTLAYNETARRASKYKIIVVGSSKPMLYDMKRGVAEPITKKSKVGKKYVV